MRWKQEGDEIELTQTSDYPFDGTVRFEVKTSTPAQFTLSFRIPAWATGASISINGKRDRISVTPGTFVPIHRQWHGGDRVEVDLPSTMRLEAVDPEHPQTVALMYGPLVLFAVTDNPPPLRREDLLGATRLDLRIWQVKTAAGPMKMVPFTEIAEEPYTTYLRVA